MRQGNNLIEMFIWFIAETNFVLPSTCAGDKWTPPADSWLIWNEGHCANPWESAALSKSHPCNPRNLVPGLAWIQIGFGETKGPHWSEQMRGPRIFLYAQEWQHCWWVIWKEFLVKGVFVLLLHIMYDLGTSFTGLILYHFTCKNQTNYTHCICIS